MQLHKNIHPTEATFFLHIEYRTRTRVNIQDNGAQRSNLFRKSKRHLVTYRLSSLHIHYAPHLAIQTRISCRTKALSQLTQAATPCTPTTIHVLRHAIEERTFCRVKRKKKCFRSQQARTTTSEDGDPHSWPREREGLGISFSSPISLLLLSSSVIRWD